MEDGVGNITFVTESFLGLIGAKKILGKVDLPLFDEKDTEIPIERVHTEDDAS